MVTAEEQLANEVYAEQQRVKREAAEGRTHLGSTMVGYWTCDDSGCWCGGRPRVGELLAEFEREKPA